MGRKKSLKTRHKRKKIMKKILISLAIIAAVGAIGFGATRAYFSDTETSTGNTFTAGSIDLALSKGNGYDNTWAGAIKTFSNMAPGQESDEFSIWFKNDGSINGTLVVNVSGNTENDVPDADQTGEYGNIDVEAVPFSKHVLVTWAEVQDSNDNVAGWWTSQIIGTYADQQAAIDDGAIVAYSLQNTNGGNSNYAPTIYGLSRVDLHYVEGGVNLVFTPGTARKESLKLMLDPAVENDYQYDGIDITLAAKLDQVQ
jgi:predicted ribosomally synthesized peptide with SipW-like signal peptide